MQKLDMALWAENWKTEISKKMYKMLIMPVAEQTRIDELLATCATMM